MPVELAPLPAARTAGEPIGSSDAPARVFDDQRGEDRVIKHIIAADRPMNRCQVHLHSGGTVPPVPLHLAPPDRSDAVAEAAVELAARRDVLSVGPRCALPVGPRSVCSAHDRCRSRRGPSRNSGRVCVLIGSPRSSAACPRERVTALSQRFMAAPARKDIRQITRSQDRRRCDDRSARLNSADPVTHLFSGCRCQADTSDKEPALSRPDRAGPLVPDVEVVRVRAHEGAGRRHRPEAITRFRGIPAAVGLSTLLATRVWWGDWR